MFHDDGVCSIHRLPLHTFFSRTLQWRTKQNGKTLIPFDICYRNGFLNREPEAIDRLVQMDTEHIGTQWDENALALPNVSSNCVNSSGMKQIKSNEKMFESRFFTYFGWISSISIQKKIC